MPSLTGEQNIRDFIACAPHRYEHVLCRQCENLYGQHPNQQCSRCGNGMRVQNPLIGPRERRERNAIVHLRTTNCPVG
jgi:ribosomal protein L37E